MKNFRPPRGNASALLLLVAMVLAGVGVLSALSDTGRERPRPAARPASRPLVVAIATFEDGTESEDLAWLRDGLAEAIDQNLSRVKGIQVVPRRLVRRAEALLRPGEDLGVLAGPLHADLVLGGEVWQEGGQIGATLIALSPPRTFAAADMLPLEELFVQAANLAGDIAGEDISPWRPTADLEAYALYIRGLRLYDEAEDDAGLAAAEKLFDEALARDSSFAAALRARAAARLWRYRATGMRTLRAKALQDTEVFLEKLPDDPRSYTVALQVFEANDEISRAFWAAARLYALAPEDPIALYRLASELLRYGLDEDATLLLEKVVRRDPEAGPALVDLAVLALLHGEPRKAELLAQRALSLEEAYRGAPDRSPLRLRGWTPISGSRTFLALSLIQQGHFEEAPRLIREDDGLYPGGGSKFGLAALPLRRRAQALLDPAGAEESRESARLMEEALLRQNPSLGAALAWALLAVDKERAVEVTRAHPGGLVRDRLLAARLLELSGHPEEARAIVQQTLTLATTESDVCAVKRRLALLDGAAPDPAFSWLTIAAP